MIEFNNVSLSYGENVVLNNVSFKADFHEKIAVLGGSGEGKTTLLRLLLGLVRPDSGMVVIDGQDITHMPESKLRDIRLRFSIVFQEGALFDSLSVRENTAFFIREYTDKTEEEIEAWVRELLRVLGIEEAIDLMPEELSGGMQRRAAIARSLGGCQPRMMLYDEATTGLDPLTAHNICNLINDLSKGEPPDRVGFIIVTHKVTDATKVAERYMYIKNGMIAFDGDLDQLRNTENEELRRFTDELHTAEQYE